MIDSFYIYSKATEMVKQTGTRNPMKIASEIGVMLRYSEELDKLLGLYTYRWKHRIILLNDKMEEIMWHEWSALTSLDTMPFIEI